MLGTRPDISYAVTKLAKYLSNPSKEHLGKALYIVRYLAGSKSYVLMYNGYSNEGIEAYTDSDWGADLDNRQSITGYLYKIAQGAVSWRAHSQSTVATSSTEAEYMALTDTSKQAAWYHKLFNVIGQSLITIPVNGDNQGSIFMASNPVTDKRSKHIDIQYHYIKEKVIDKSITLYYIEGTKNIADMFTKNLGHIKFYQFRSQLGLIFYDNNYTYDKEEDKYALSQI